MKGEPGSPASSPRPLRRFSDFDCTDPAEAEPGHARSSLGSRLQNRELRTRKRSPLRLREKESPEPPLGLSRTPKLKQRSTW
jgi:hypothetical protein